MGLSAAPAMAPKTRNAMFTSDLAANFAFRSSRPMAFCHESSPRDAFGVEGFPELAILPPDGVPGQPEATSLQEITIYDTQS